MYNASFQILELVIFTKWECMWNNACGTPYAQSISCTYPHLVDPGPDTRLAYAHVWDTWLSFMILAKKIQKYLSSLALKRYLTEYSLLSPYTR